MLELLGVVIAVEAVLKRGRYLMSTWAMSQDMPTVLESVAGFQIGADGAIGGTDTDPDAENDTPTVLPYGAPKAGWDKWIGRARVALSESAARRAARWEALESGEELPDDDCPPETIDYETYEEYEQALAEHRRLLEEQAASGFDFDGGRDYDDSRWEAIGSVRLMRCTDGQQRKVLDSPALDPYWSTCPAVIDDQFVIADSERFTALDGQQELTWAERHRIDNQRALATEWRAERCFLGELYKLGARSKAIVAKGRLAAQLSTGYESLMDITSQSLLKSIGWSKDGGPTRETNAQERGYMQHGGCMRESRWLRIGRMMADGVAYLTADHAAGVGFLSWLSKCWVSDMESRIYASWMARKKRSNVGNTVLACGRDYFLTARQSNDLRKRRTEILKQWAIIGGLSFEKGRRFIAAYSRKHWETSANKQGESIGARRMMDFGPNPVKSAGPRESWALTEAARAHVAQLAKHRELVRNRKMAYVNGQMMVLG